MRISVIVAGARTPIGRLNGSLSGLSSTDLGGIAIKSAVERAGISPDQVQYVVMGQVLQAGVGQGPARQAAIKGGLSMDVPSVVVNKVCLSGLNAIALADQLIRVGEYDVIVAGGMESMTNAPHILMNSRVGFKLGDATLKDSMMFDGLFCSVEQMGMGESTEKYNPRYSMTREVQDEFAFQSHQRAAKAQSNGIFEEEIVSVELRDREGNVTLFAKDEGIREEISLEALSKLKPVFSPTGTITAGSASQISDGAAAVVVMLKERAIELGLSWLCEIGAQGMVAGPDASLHEQPANAIKLAVKKEGISLDQLDFVEINEAFAAVGIVSSNALGFTSDMVNVHGGAIAVGHPLGMSGARLVLHLAYQLKNKGSGYAVAALCGGGGQGDALILKR
ncbi:MAG: acetyl-CoA C-acetyltransferase [Candidatus Nanopelagicaceae bacterium]|nr:acetyl-CoA C-acetyltransferase [Candidatus Nanopelagicaceae bacterium]